MRQTRNPHKVLVNKPEIIDSLMIDMLSGCLVASCVPGLTDFLTGCLAEWLPIWLTHLLPDWPIFLLDVWLTDWLSGWLIYSRTDRFLTGCLAEWLAVWLTRCSRAVMLPNNTFPSTCPFMFHVYYTFIMPLLYERRNKVKRNSGRRWII
jgi:hypothetical protein